MEGVREGGKIRDREKFSRRRRNRQTWRVG